MKRENLIGTALLLSASPAFAGTPGLFTLSLFSSGVVFSILAFLAHRMTKPVYSEKEKDETPPPLKTVVSEKYTPFNPDVIRKMDWRGLEFLVAECFKGKRNSSTKTSAFGVENGGVNVRLTNADGELTIIICDVEKRGLTLPKMREIIGIKTHEKAKTCIATTFGKTDREIKQLGIVNGIKIVNEEELALTTASLPVLTMESLQQALLGSPEWDKQTCPKCGRKMNQKGGSSTHRCSRYPECTGTLDIQS